ncbi:MAG: YncE family protein, partial [Polyangiaceae bacterium]|nr:YncE family protein [Polyangiaceae bacterium]
MPFNSRRARVARLLAPALFAIPSIAPALEQGDFGPDRTVGPKSNGFIVASSAQNLTPAGSLVILGAPVRAKAVALNPTNNTAAVLTMGAAEAVIVLDRTSGAIIQNYKDPSKTGSFTGITYSVDGTKLFFSQDNNNVVIANVDPATGALALASAVSLPEPPSGTPYSYYTASAINPGGIGVSPDGTKAYVALNAANTLGVIDVASGTLTAQIPVGNVPNQVVITADGHYAYVTNQGGRPALSGDFVQDSDGTAIVADPTDAFAITGTVSVVDLTTNTEVKTIDVGLQPVGLFLTGDRLYVANAYSDTVSVIDTNRNEVVRTIDVRVPVPVRTVGDEPTSITVVGERAYVTLSQSNAVAVIDLAGRAFTNPVLGYIPTAYYPASIAYDAVNKQLVVAEDKGVGTQEITTTSYGVKGYATHSDGGTISLIPVPNEHDLGKYTEQVFENNHWNLRNPALQVGREFVNRFARPVPVPRHIGEPSVIKHVFLVIKENRTYDQILGDVAYGNGDASLAVFGAATPNQHALVQRFPLLDNTYAPSRQSGDGHPWIINSGSFYANEILSPDWIRQYGVDALTYSTHGFLWSAAERAGLTAASYGEVHNKGGIDKNPATGKAYIWDDYYNTSLCNEGKLDAATCATLTQVPYTAFHYGSTIPSLSKILDPQYPDFNLTVPDQYRVDYWLTAFAQQLATNTVPNFNVFRICDDHTNGTSASYPSP